MNNLSLQTPSRRVLWFRRFRRELPLHLYLLPAVILVVLFCYIPMVGIVIAFQNFRVFKGWFSAPWVGLENFLYVINLPNFGSVMFNTVYISVLKILFSLVVPILVALMFNEMQHTGPKRILQTVMYLPYFMSWIILGGIIKDMLDSNGLLNNILTALGMEKVNLLTSNATFRGVLVVTDIWKNFGFNTIVYLAALGRFGDSPVQRGGVVDQIVDASEVGDDPVRETVERLPVGQVALKIGVFQQVDDADVRALLPEFLADAPSDALRAAGDDGDFVLESHGCPSISGAWRSSPRGYAISEVSVAE